jgi:nucleotide-binding universal stress UspA family protein
MSYKTILVHLNDTRRAEAMLEPAIELATRYNSHLKGLHVDAITAAPPLSLTYAASGPGPAAAEERANGEAIAALFTRMTATGGCAAEWQRLKVPLGDLVAVVLEQGRTADLIVAGQADPDWDLSAVLDFPERLALESGRPVLVIPYVGR